MGDGDTQNQTAQTPPLIADDAQSSDYFPPTPPTPPVKKFGNNKIIATFLGLAMLMGGLGAGVVLVSQPQLLEQRAQTVTYCSSSGETRCIRDKTKIQACDGSVWRTATCGGKRVCLNGQCVLPSPTPTSKAGKVIQVPLARNDNYECQRQKNQPSAYGVADYFGAGQAPAKCNVGDLDLGDINYGGQCIEYKCYISGMCWLGKYCAKETEELHAKCCLNASAYNTQSNDFCKSKSPAKLTVQFAHGTIDGKTDQRSEDLAPFTCKENVTNQCIDQYDYQSIVDRIVASVPNGAQYFVKAFIPKGPPAACTWMGYSNNQVTFQQGRFCCP